MLLGLCVSHFYIPADASTMRLKWIFIFKTDKAKKFD